MQFKVNLKRFKLNSQLKSTLNISISNLRLRYNYTIISLRELTLSILNTFKFTLYSYSRNNNKFKSICTRNLLRRSQLLLIIYVKIVLKI